MPSDTAVYTHGFHPSVLRSHTWRTARNSAGYLLPLLRPGLSLLDVGCGPGTITADLAALVAPGRVTGVDAAEEALAEARATLTERGMTGVDLVRADVSALGFPDDHFDVVHAHQVLQHLADPVAALREMRRVCRPDGVVAVRDSDYLSMTWYPEVPALADWLALYRAVASANGGEPDAGRRLLSWARRAGFREVTPSASVWCFATAVERSWWSELWAERMTSSAIARQAVAEGRATERDLARIADGWRTWGASEDGWFTVVHGEALARR